ncbi:MAG: hypothetical protein R3B38_01095 [Patescibacteria group bacterium]
MDKQKLVGIGGPIPAELLSELHKLEEEYEDERGEGEQVDGSRMGSANCVGLM